MDITFDTFTSLGSNIIQRIKHWQFGNKAQLAFLEDFYLLINDGIPANRAIEMMAHVSKGITHDVAIAISQKISEGQALAEGMNDWFAVNVVEIIRVGEEGGALAETIKSAVTTLSQRGGAWSGLMTAISYPLMVITMACIIIVYLNNSVFIQFRAIKPIAQWPDAGRQLIAVAQGIENWWWMFFLVLIASFVGLRMIMMNYVGDLRSVLDNFPPFSLYRRFVASRFMETLGLLVVNGVVFKSALKIMQYQSTPYLLSHLMMMEHLLGMGKGNVADVLSTGLIDNEDILRLRVMAEVKGFEHGLVRMGVHGSEKNIKTVKLIAKVIGGMLLAIGAVLIITIVRGIYLTGMAMGSV